MRENYTVIFISLVNKVLDAKQEYFKSLSNSKKNGVDIKNNILYNLCIKYEKHCFDFNEILKDHIKNFILEQKDCCLMNANILQKISTQIEIDCIEKKLTEDKARLYYTLASSLSHYGILKNEMIPSFENSKFWEGLITRLYLLNLEENNSIDMMNLYFYNTQIFKNNPDFNRISNLIDAKKLIKDKLKEDINIIDSVVVFKKGQENRIVTKIEKKLHLLDLFMFLQLIFNIYKQHKEKHQVEIEPPYKYTINLLVKNINKSKHKNKNKDKMLECFEIIKSFITLYQLKENKFESMFLTIDKLESHLKNQAFYMSLYPIYQLSTSTLIQYIRNLVEPNIHYDEFYKKFSFSIDELIKFLISLDNYINFTLPDIIELKPDPNTNTIKILDKFSVDTKNINENYGSIESLPKVQNLFELNPVIKFKDSYYIIGFQYFKMSFYSSLVEKIRQEIDNNITGRIGTSVDDFVKKLFTEIKDQHNCKIFSGRYKPPKKENPESDLVIKSDNDIIFIENKNKYLTHQSFSGDSSYILKDYICSFVFSQTQLLNHERNLKTYKKLSFYDKKELQYNGENIVKISISTNNWYNFMGNPPVIILPLLANIRFNIAEDKIYANVRNFEEANRYLEKLKDILKELNNNKQINVKTTLTQSIFLPLELIVEKHNDKDFINILRTLIQIKMNVANILDIYDYQKILFNKIRK